MVKFVALFGIMTKKLGTQLFQFGLRAMFVSERGSFPDARKCSAVKMTRPLAAHHNLIFATVSSEHANTAHGRHFGTRKTAHARYLPLHRATLGDPRRPLGALFSGYPTALAQALPATALGLLPYR